MIWRLWMIKTQRFIQLEPFYTIFCQAQWLMEPWMFELSGVKSASFLAIHNLCTCTDTSTRTSRILQCTYAYAKEGWRKRSMSCLANVEINFRLSCNSKLYIHWTVNVATLEKVRLARHRLSLNIVVNHDSSEMSSQLQFDQRCWASCTIFLFAHWVNVLHQRRSTLTSDSTITFTNVWSLSYIFWKKKHWKTC